MATPRTIAFHTLGCKLNFSETSTIRRSFEQHGFSTVSWNDEADVYLINTCSVTESADKKCRAAVRQALKRQNDAKIVVIGCYAQLKPEEIANIPGVDLVLGAAEKFNVTNFVDSLSKSTSKGMVRSTDIKEVNGFEHAFSFGDRTRTFLKLQDGCDYKCSFCTIPMARGKARNPNVEEVVAQAKNIAKTGVKEIVLTGVNIGDFKIGSGSSRQSFIDLIGELDNVDGIDRFRISSIEPNLCSDEIIKFVAKSRKFVPHFHMPLQSGSDYILREMRRRYPTGLYKERVNLIKQHMPHCCIGVDVIVGFPGEEIKHFEETYEFISGMDISYLHVFTYSDRTGTAASVKGGKVPMNIRRSRNAELRKLSDQKRRNFYKQHLGSSRNVLFEKGQEAITGFTDNYVKVEVKSKNEALINRVSPVYLSHVLPNGHVFGEIIEEPTTVTTVDSNIYANS